MNLITIHSAWFHLSTNSCIQWSKSTTENIFVPKRGNFSITCQEHSYIAFITKQLSYVETCMHCADSLHACDLRCLGNWVVIRGNKFIHLYLDLQNTEIAIEWLVSGFSHFKWFHCSRKLEILLYNKTEKCSYNNNILQHNRNCLQIAYLTRIIDKIYISSLRMDFRLQSFCHFEKLYWCVQLWALWTIQTIDILCDFVMIYWRDERIKAWIFTIPSLFYVFLMR